MKIVNSSIIIFLQCITVVNISAQHTVVISSLDELYSYAEDHSSTFRNAGQLTILAKYRTLAAKLGAVNLMGQGSFTLTDNTKLGINFIPAEVFGGPAGTFRPATFGQKYVSNFIFAPQIDLINPYAIALIKIAKTNQQLTQVNNLLKKKTVYESISASYHNIRSYQWQIDVTSKSLRNADTLTKIFQDKQKQGLVRSQDVNIAIAHQLLVKDKLQQLSIQLEQQYNNLKILCDISPLTTIMIKEKDTSASDVEFAIEATGDLLQRQGEWQTKYQQALLRADKRWMYPSLQLFSSISWQESNNNHFFESNTWFGANYIGLKLSIPLVPEVSRIATVKYDRVNLEIARNNWNHSKLQDQLNNNQLELDYRKAIESYRLATQIEALREDSYQKNLAIYREGIISSQDLINSFDDWLNSSLNTAALLASAEYAKSKIIISSTIK